jgi:hypothetical protein
MSHSNTAQLKQLIAELQDLIDGDGRAITFNSATMKGHILPDTNAAYDFGSAEYKIRHLFLSDNSLWVGDNHKVDIEGGKMKFRKRKGQQPIGMQNLLHDFIMETDAALTPSLPISGGVVDVAAYQSATVSTQANDRTALITSAAIALVLNIVDLAQVTISEWEAITRRIGESEAGHIVPGKTWSVATNLIEPAEGSELRFSDMWKTASDLFDLTQDFDVELGRNEPDLQEDGVAGTFSVSNSFGHTQAVSLAVEDIVVFTYPTDSYVGGRMTLHIKDNNNPTPNSMVREYLFVNDMTGASINAQGTRVLAGGQQITDAQTASIVGGEVNLKIQTTTAWNSGHQFFGKLIIELIAM